MAIIDQRLTDRYAIYNSDCMEVLSKIPDGKIHLSAYSPPFGGLYHYSSSDRDLSNNMDYESFFKHYDFVVKEIARITMPGRMTAVHCMDIPRGNSGTGIDCLIDFPGDIIRQHQRMGFNYVSRYHIWKEPLRVRNRTMAKKLTHAQIVSDSTLTANAGGDYLLVFRKHGENPVPVTHDRGLMDYAGARTIPPDLLRYRGWDGNQIENRYSQWIWRQYASCVWDDIRIERVLPFKHGRDENDEKHVNPLQLDVIERVVELCSNPGETVLTPFMGVGSEVYGAIVNGRKGLGIELKPSYFKQAIKNVEAAYQGHTIKFDQATMDLSSDDPDWPDMEVSDEKHRRPSTPATRMVAV